MSQFIFNNPDMRGRLVRHGEDWFVGEYKPNDPNAQWFPWICGTRAWLQLDEAEVAGAVLPKNSTKVNH